MSVPRQHRGIDRNGSRIRTCGTCGTVEEVRKDNRSTTCRRCACRKARAKAIQALPTRVPNMECSGCGASFRRNLSSAARARENYCSLACRRQSQRIGRECMACGKQFHVPRSVLSGRTNASAHFCCRGCYESWLCKPDRVTGRGSQWNKVRREVLVEQPFCACCGTFKSLQIHHIVPFRVTHDNALRNLIPLCVRCHKRVEWITTQIEVTGARPSDMGFFMRRALRFTQTLTLLKLREIRDSIAA